MYLREKEDPCKFKVQRLVTKKDWVMKAEVCSWTSEQVECDSKMQDFTLTIIFHRHFFL